MTILGIRHIPRSLTMGIKKPVKIYPKLRYSWLLILIVLLIIFFTARISTNGSSNNLSVGTKQILENSGSIKGSLFSNMPGYEELENGSRLVKQDVVIRKGSTEWTDYVLSYDDDDLRSRLSKNFVYDRNSVIPKVVYQTWKESFEGIKDQSIKISLKSWMDESGYDHKFLNNLDIEKFVNTEYSQFPEIIETYNKLPLDILKFDFIRYLLIYAKGGIYSDVDTSLVKNLEDWIDSSIDIKFSESFGTKSKDIVFNKDIGFIIGIESDYDSNEWKYKTSRRVQFCQWTFKAKKGHPILREIINNIVQTTLHKFNSRLNHVKIGSEYYTLHSVYTILEWTGPGLFTDRIFDHLNLVFRQNVKYVNTNKKPQLKYVDFNSRNKERNSIDVENDLSIGWSTFSKMEKPVIIDDVLILPINSFNGFIGDVEFPIDNQFTYVKHEFKGSWKSLI